MSGAAATSQALQWHLHLDVLVLLLVLVGGYVVALHVLGPRVASDSPPTTRHYFCYFSGVFALWLGADWPLHELAEGYLYSAHMVQHLLFSFVAPPLLLLGIPKWLLRSALDALRLEGLVRVLTRPIVALALFNVTIAVTHWPALVDASLRSEIVHFLLHVALVSAALLMWWPVVDPLPEMSRLSEPGKMLYLFLQSVLPTVPASFLTFASEPLYRFYETVPRLWGLDVVTDQRIAGLIMKLGGGLLLWGVITGLFFRWSSKEEATEQRGAKELVWDDDDFERDLRAHGLRK